MGYLEMHCDTLLGAGYGEKIDLFENQMAVDWKRMKATGFSGQFYAMCLMPEDSFQKHGMKKPDDMTFMKTLSNCFYQNLEAHSDIAAFAANREDLLRNEQQGKISCFLSAEDGNGIGGKLEGLEEMYRMGVRMISITWNHENCLGYPNSFDADKMALPLKPFGREMIDAMNRMGVIVDVSHLSDGGFWDVVEICKQNHKPFVASHSNSRAMTPHSRNMTDEMIRALAECGGVMGLNYCASFLSPEIPSRISRIDDMVRHLKHIYQVGGIDCMGMGGDLDGTFGDLEVNAVEKTPLLFDRLKKEGFTESELDKIAYQNVLRVIGETLK